MSAIEEIRDLAPKLSPRAFAARLAYWRRGGLPAGGLSERVGGSRGHKLPAFDPTDQRLNQAEADYKLALDGFVQAMADGDHKGALKKLREAETLERIWLVPIEKLDAEALKALDGMISDAASCQNCGITKEAWLKKQRQLGRRRALWRVRAGLCQACYMDRYRKRTAELEVIDPVAS